MRPISTHVARSAVYPSGTMLSSAEADKPIEVPFVGLTCVGPKATIPARKGTTFEGGLAVADPLQTIVTMRRRACGM